MVMTLKIQIQTAEVGWPGLALEIEKIQLKWFLHLIRIPSGHLPLEVFQAHQTGKRSRVDPEYATDLSQLAWEFLGIPRWGLKI